MRYHKELTASHTHSSTGENLPFDVPGFARAAIFYIDLSAVAGTTPVFDAKLQYFDAVGNDFIDVDNATMAQQTTAAQTQMIIDPAATADTTGNQKAIGKPLSSRMRWVTTCDRTTGDETYTFSISADFYE